MDNIDNFEVEIDVETLSNEEINQGPSEKKQEISIPLKKNLKLFNLLKNMVSNQHIGGIQFVVEAFICGLNRRKSYSTFMD